MDKTHNALGQISSGSLGEQRRREAGFSFHRIFLAIGVSQAPSSTHRRTAKMGRVNDDVVVSVVSLVCSCFSAGAA